MTFIGRWNYHNELGAAVSPPKLRVVYAASGTQPAACLLCGSSAVVEHGIPIWWAPYVSSESERSFYLVAALK